MESFPTLQTARLVLREIVRADAPALFAIHSDSELKRWFGTEPMSDLRAAENLIDRLASGRQLPSPDTCWGIQLKDDPHLIGTCGLFHWNRGWKACMIGFELAWPMRGKGLMHEALGAVLGWGFGQMALNRVEAQVHPLNFAALRLLRGLGFVEEGALRELGYWGGSFHTLLQFSLLHHEFRPFAAGEDPPAAPSS